ncbi:MAG TPA: Uma2 family endonuclease [Polyangiaceae bacterium]|jgi:Uma2 family endonuclease|nr:Uma2 family endonuclease [Polyangiaceae bacterium]
MTEIKHGEFVGPDVQDDVLLYVPEDAGQYEWIDGHIREVSEPQVEHGFVCTKVTVALGTYVDEHKLGMVLSADTLFLLQEEPRNVRGPDVVFVDKSKPMPRVHGVWFIAPDLVVEVQSPSQRGKFMLRKSSDYLKAGVRLVWVVDPQTRTVVRYRNGEEPVTLQEHDVLDGEDVIPGFRCPISGLFPPPRAGLPRVNGGS